MIHIRQIIPIFILSVLGSCNQQSDLPKADKFPGFTQVGRDQETSRLFVDLESVKRSNQGTVSFKLLRVIDSGYAIQDAITNCRDHFKGLTGTKFTTEGVSDSEYSADANQIPYKDNPALTIMVSKVCDKADESRMITGAFDDIKALEVIYGPYNPELKAAYWTNINPPETLAESASNFTGKNGLVKIVLSKEYNENNDTKRILLTQTNLAEGGNECHACGVLLGAIVFVHVGDKWRIELENRYLDVSGANGEPPELAWADIGKDTYVITEKMTDIHQGVVSGFIGIYKLDTNSLQPLLESLEEDESLADVRLTFSKPTSLNTYAEALISIEYESKNTKTVKEKKFIFNGSQYQLQSPDGVAAGTDTNSQSQSLEQTANTSTPIPNNNIPIPRHVIGDTYVTEVINLVDGEHGNTAERRVVSVEPTKIVIESKSLSSKKGTVRVLDYTPEWNLIRTRNPDGEGLDYSPPLKYFEFPLYQGRNWQQTSIETNSKTGAQRVHTLNATVGEWEMVTTPAGSFKAIKIMTNSELLDQATGQKTSGSDTSWYVPELRRSVRSETSSKKPDGSEDKQVIQLLNYKIEN